MKFSSFFPTIFINSHLYSCDCTCKYTIIKLNNTMCFRCLIFSLSCECVYFCFVLLPLGPEVVSVMLYPCMFCLPCQWIVLFCVLRV